MPHATTRSVLVFSVLPLTCQCDHQICVGVLCVTPNMPVSPPVLCWCSLCHPCHVHIKQLPLKDLSVHYSSCSACCSKCYININNCSLCCTECSVLPTALHQCNQMTQFIVSQSVCRSCCSLCCTECHVNTNNWHSSLYLSQSVVVVALRVVQNVNTNNWHNSLCLSQFTGVAVPRVVQNVTSTQATQSVYWSCCSLCCTVSRQHKHLPLTAVYKAVGHCCCHSLCGPKHHISLSQWNDRLSVGQITTIVLHTATLSHQHK